MNVGIRLVYPIELGRSIPEISAQRANEGPQEVFMNH